MWPPKCFQWVRCWSGPARGSTHWWARRTWTPTQLAGQCPAGFCDTIFDTGVHKEYSKFFFLIWYRKKGTLNTFLINHWIGLSMACLFVEISGWAQTDCSASNSLKSYIETLEANPNKFSVLINANHIRGCTGSQNNMKSICWTCGILIITCRGLPCFP